MNQPAEVVTWVAFGLVAYVYLGYPLLLVILAKMKHKAIVQKPLLPSVTLIISAFNEERAIAKKLENSLSLEYPSSQLEILVISDASTDATDRIVQSFSVHGVKLLRLPTRSGKTAGLNEGVKIASGDILVFSDANILYEKKAVSNLMRNFADPSVGCVTGDARYLVEGETSSGTLERKYWAIEQIIRANESRLGSTVGGDGAIFSIRRELFSSLPTDAINDFLIPLQIVVRGFRAVYEPAAIGFEPAAGSLWGEFRRKRRIVNRSWKALSHCPDPLLPWRVGWLFSWQIWSHKVLRWLTGLFVVIGTGAAFLCLSEGWVYQVPVWGFGGGLFFAMLGMFVPEKKGRIFALLQGPLYLFLVNIGAIWGILSATLGQVETRWVPERVSESALRSGPSLPKKH